MKRKKDVLTEEERKAKLAKYHKEWYEKNKGKYRERNKIRSKMYYWSHRAKCLEQSRENRKKYLIEFLKDPKNCREAARNYALASEKFFHLSAQEILERKYY